MVRTQARFTKLYVGLLNLPPPPSNMIRVNNTCHAVCLPLHHIILTLRSVAVLTLHCAGVNGC